MDNRDRTIESLLRRREMEPSQPTDQCVDAESLAAWMEGGLSAEAHAQVEQHAAGCARCQALLASMARTASDIEVAPWWRSVTAKWLVPVAAIATAVIVWISVGRESVPSTMQPPPSVQAPPPASVPEASAAPAVPVPEPPASRPEPVGASAANAPTSRAKAAETPARQELDKLERRQAATDAFRPQGQMMADSSARSTAPQPPAAAPATVATPTAAAPTAQPANAAAGEAKPAPVSGLAEPVGGTREVAARQRAAGFAETVAGIEIQSSDPSYRWRIISPSGIQRSTDGGTTWSTVDPLRAATRADGTTTSVLTAGSSPSRDVCWIVGRGGTVLLSTNGATWQRRPFPESVDLTAVRASSATNALVTAADGRRFVTVDAGATWNLVK
jgi:putative zinc finger protein